MNWEDLPGPVKRVRKRIGNPCGEILFEDRSGSTVNLGELLRRKLSELSVQQTIKEKTEMHNINALITLTDQSTRNELKDLGIDTALPEAVRVAYEKKKADEQAAAASQAADLIISLERHRNEKLMKQADQLRFIRKQEKEIKAQMTMINRAAAFGRKTMNYVPLHTLLIGGFRPDGMSREDWEKLSKVPDDFVVEEPAKQEQSQ